MKTPITFWRAFTDPVLLSVPSELERILFLIHAAGVSKDRDRLLVSETVAAALEVMWSVGGLL